MDSTTDVATLADCVAPLDEDGRRAVRRYWERVIQEEWVAPSRRMPGLTLFDGSGRRGREARRAVARIAAAGRLGSLPAGGSSAPGGLGVGSGVGV